MSGETTMHIAHCLDRLRGGDDQARQDLLAHASERLRRMATRMSNDFRFLQRWEDSDDVLQNSLVRLYRALADVPPESPRKFFGLAALQIRRELLDLARQYRGAHGLAANHASVRESQGPPVPSAESSVNPAKLAEWTEFHRLIDRLPAEDREIVDLLWYHELSQEEAASLLDVSVRTIKRRWQHARLLLGELMSPGQGAT